MPTANLAVSMITLPVVAFTMYFSPLIVTLTTVALEIVMLKTEPISYLSPTVMFTNASRLDTVNAPDPSYMIVFVPLVSMNTALTSYSPAANSLTGRLAVITPETFSNDTFCFRTSPPALVMTIVTLPVWFPATVTVIVLVSFTYTLGALTINSPVVLYTSNEVLFSLARYLPFSRYFAVTL